MHAELVAPLAAAGVERVVGADKASWARDPPLGVLCDTLFRICIGDSGGLAASTEIDQGRPRLTFDFEGTDGA